MLKPEEKVVAKPGKFLCAWCFYIWPATFYISYNLYGESMTGLSFFQFYGLPKKKKKEEEKEKGSWQASMTLLHII